MLEGDDRFGFVAFDAQPAVPEPPERVWTKATLRVNLNTMTVITEQNRNCQDGRQADGELRAGGTAGVVRRSATRSPSRRAG